MYKTAHQNKKGLSQKGAINLLFRRQKGAHLENEKLRQQSRQEDQNATSHKGKPLGFGFTYLQSMDFQRESQSEHHLYYKQEKPAHCYGSLLLRLGTHQIQNRTRDANKISPRYELRPRGQLGWGSGLALAIWVGLGRVGQEVKKKQSKK